MKRSRLQETSMEVTVGAFIFMVLLALGFFTIVLSRENMFTPTYQLEVVFSDVKGLREGDDVFVRGVTVGKIKALDIRPDAVHVMVTLDKPVEIHEGYIVESLSASVLGGRYVNIYEGLQDKPLLPKTEVIRGTTPPDFGDEGGRTVKLIKQALQEGGILTNIEATVANLRDVTTKINKGEGTLGKLLSDDKMYDELQLTLHEARAAIDDFRETAPITTFSSIFFGAF